MATAYNARQIQTRAAESPKRTHTPFESSSRREKTRAWYAALEEETCVRRRDELYERIVIENMPMAAAVARRYRARGEAQDDLEQVAYVGLVKAAHGFDQKYGSDFLTYAVPTISGEIKRHFRDKCWAVRPPRRLQELQARISAIQEEMVSRLARYPSSAEVSAELGVPEADALEAMSLRGCYTPSSLDAPIGPNGSGTIGGNLADVDATMDASEARMVVNSAVRDLGERDRVILKLRFVEGWTQQRIARRIGVTQMQVSRLLTRILHDLGDRVA